MLLEETTEGESYVDSHHERVAGKNVSASDERSTKLIKGRRDSITKKASNNGFGHNKLTTTVSQPSLHLPRLVNNANVANERQQVRENKIRFPEKERLPDVADDDDCPNCRRNREAMLMQKMADGENKTSSKGISFTVPISSQKNVPIKKVVSQPALTGPFLVDGDQKPPKQPVPPSRPPSRLKSGAASRRTGPPPSSLAVPAISVVESKDEDVLPVEVDVPVTSRQEIISQKQDMKLALSEEKPSSVLPVITVSGANSSRRSEVSIVSTPIRGTVLSSAAEATPRNISQAPPSFVVPPRLLAGLSPRVQCAPLDQSEAIRLKTLVFGSPFRKPTDAWRLQSFSFSPENLNSSLSAPRFVILQRANTGTGTTGVLGVVQAELLRQILYATNNSNNGVFDHKQEAKPLNAFNTLRLLSRSQRSDALGSALSEIICRAATSPKSPFAPKSVSQSAENVAKVVIPCGRRVLPVDGSIADDGITEKLLVFTFPFGDSSVLLRELRSFFRQHLVHFDTDGSGGVLLVLYSVVLSRGIDTIYADIDEANCQSLITADAYTSTEALTLFLTGVASSYVFNDDMFVQSATSSSASNDAIDSMLTPTSSASPISPTDTATSDSGNGSLDDISNSQSVRQLRGIYRRNDLGLLTINEFQTANAVTSPNVDPSVKKDKLEQMQQAKNKIAARLQRLEKSVNDNLKQQREKFIKVGSYLKTPKFPIWVCQVSANNTRFCVLYSTNIELVSNWRAERLFDLFCLDAWLIPADREKLPAVLSLSSCLQPMRLRLDAIDRPTVKAAGFDLYSSDDSDDRDAEDENSRSKTCPPVEQVLQTKWPGAIIDYYSLPNG